MPRQNTYARDSTESCCASTNGRDCHNLNQEPVIMMPLRDLDTPARNHITVSGLPVLDGHGSHDKFLLFEAKWGAVPDLEVCGKNHALERSLWHPVETNPQFGNRCNMTNVTEVPNAEVSECSMVHRTNGHALSPSFPRG